MFFSTKALVAVISCALFAHAQSTPNGTVSATAPGSSPSVPAGLDTCILTCVTTAAAAAGCSSFQDLTCVCESTAFQQSALSCLQSNCTAEDLQTALALQQQECGSSSSGVISSTSGALTGSATASTPVATTPSTATSTPKSSSTSTGTSSGSGSGSGSGSNGAMALSAPVTFGGLVGLVGALAGAALVL